MPIQQSVSSPYSTATLESYAYNTRFSIDLVAKSISILVARYADKASLEAGKQPVQVVPYTLSGADFDAYVAANQEAYLAIKQAVEAYVLTRPEFAGGAVVD